MQNIFCLLTRFANFVIICPDLIKTIAKLQNILPLLPQTFYKPTKYRMPSPNNPLRINVGYIIHADIGYNRKFEFALDSLDLDGSTSVSDLNGHVQFSRTQSGLLVEAAVTSQIQLDCSRCLDEFDHSLEMTFTELYAFDKKNMTESELLIPDTGFIDLTPLFQDYFLLSIPINPICKTDCAGLCPVCGINKNNESCDCHTESIDPRLASLKDLLDKEEE